MVRTVRELSRDEMTELKQNYLFMHLEVEGRNPSMYELQNIDNYISDEYMYEQYEDYTFTSDDFFCNIENNA